MAGWISMLLRESVTAPREAARRLIAMDLPMETRWLGFALVVVLSTLLAQIVRNVFPMGEPVPWEAMMQTPLRTVLVMGILTLTMAALAVMLGRLFGGRGEFGDALLLMTWLQFILFVLQFVQLVAIILLPPLSVLMGVLSIALFFYLMTQFVMVLHGFQKPVRVFFGVIGGFFVAAFIISMILATLGVTIVAEAP